ncbi:N-acetylglucosaminephosphotransferase [Pyrrhoderma noxium]|uniref:UDP-N-acetylglucosamine--dolichyl-phosphate N-acetylglucosaminephosphotransferase n=1 Tax=Pyrrhoderma noxium TaxID=2282107 RepID=A0A286UD08_9AGAM|nr:N-acetylglucosaminephosphotransferase [Pyrrhoderma noxium]
MLELEKSDARDFICFDTFKLESEAELDYCHVRIESSEMSLKPRKLPSRLTLTSLLSVSAWCILRPLFEPVPALPSLFTTFGFSIIALLATLYLIPIISPLFVKAGLKGKDRAKVYSDDIPESQGLVCASAYILLLILFIPFAFSNFISKTSRSNVEGITANDFPHFQLSVYLSSVLSLLMATMLGFLDDVFDIRWRYKLPIPIIASIPLLLVYYAEQGNTNVVVPIPFRWLLGTIINLGPLYYLYMALLSTFATNSINILAGINGAEASQALIIALSVLLNDCLYLPWSHTFRLPLWLLGGKADIEFGGVWSAGMAHGSRELVERHLFSIYFMLPLVGVCLGFLYHNWYPARVFPGDTLCYVTGMAFAVVGIQAHFSKTLLLFFIPQIFNFLLSCPQLFGLVPCPRHRVPRFDGETNLLHPSTTTFKDKPPSHLTTIILRVLSLLGLTKLTWTGTKTKTRAPSPGSKDSTSKDEVITEATNLTILNVLLLRLGPMMEKRLVQVLIATQVFCNAFAFVIRYGMAWLVYDGDRR